MQTVEKLKKFVNDLAKAVFRESQVHKQPTPEFAINNTRPLVLWCIVKSDDIFYVGLHSDEGDLWRAALGWATDEIIDTFKAGGWQATRCQVRCAVDGEVTEFYGTKY